MDRNFTFTFYKDAKLNSENSVKMLTNTGCGNSIGTPSRPLLHSYVVEGTPMLLLHPVTIRKIQKIFETKSNRSYLQYNGP